MGQSADGYDRVTQNGPMDDSGLDEPVTHNERFFVAKFLNWQSSKLSCIRLFIGATLTRKAKKLAHSWKTFVWSEVLLIGIRLIISLACDDASPAAAAAAKMNSFISPSCIDTVKKSQALLLPRTWGGNRESLAQIIAPI